MIRIKEIFGPTLQGEGTYAGEPAVFIRVSGCNAWSGREADKPSSLCPYCDTDFLGGVMMAFDAIVANVLEIANGARLVVITGGEPSLYDLTGLVVMLKTNKFKVQVETNGIKHASWFKLCDHVCVSPKVPFADCKIEWLTASSIKVLYPHPNPKLIPEDFAVLNGIVEDLFIQPIWKDGAITEQDFSTAVNKVIELAPVFKLSLQQHKIIGVQ